MAKTIKPPLCRISAGFHFKNPPEGYRGLTTENWTFGKNDVPTSLADILGGLVFEFSKFYLDTMQNVTAKEFNAEMDKLGKLVAKMRIEEPEEEPQEEQIT